MGLFEFLTKGAPDWHLPLNRNFKAAQEKLDELYSQMSNKVDWVRAYNPNLLINADFDQFIINQRNQDEYSSAGYTIDRWRLWITSGENGKLKLNDGYITLSKENTIYQTDIRQTIECEQLQGKTVTYTIKYRTNSEKGVKLYGFSDKVLENVIVLPTTNGDFAIASTKFKVPIGAKYLILLVSMNNVDVPSAEIDIAAIKLELGDHQTLAHQDESGNWVLNSPPLDKALELTKCQRYLQLFRANACFRACAIYPNYIDFDVPLNTYLRVTPTLVSNNIMLGLVSVSGAQPDFTFSVATWGVSIRVRATKNAHGLTDARLIFSEAGCGFDAEIY